MQFTAGTVKTRTTVQPWMANAVDCGIMRYMARTHEKHGMSRSSEYLAWLHIKDRCFNPKDKKYSYYGGRGIKVCPEWKDSFVAFIESVGRKPSPEHTLDRINNDGNYESGNVRWATYQEQNLNRRINKNNKSGIRGVSYNNGRQKWEAQIVVSYKKKFLGYYDTPHEAKRAYELAVSQR